MKYSFYVVPKWNSTFKVTEDCCYEQVIYDGSEIGVKSKNDEIEDVLNSWNLLCYSCNPSIEIIPTTEAYYNLKKQLVNYRMAG